MVVNLLRGYPIVSLAAAVGIAGVLHWLWVGGPAAEKFLDGQPHADTYWLRVWGPRCLLWAWDDTALPEVRLALDDEHWRVREMAIKVISEHLLGDFIPAAAEIDDPVPRVRQAAHLALTRLTAGGA